MSDAAVISEAETRSASKAGSTERAASPRVAAVERAALRGSWFVVIPGLLAGLVARYLVPTPAEALGTRVEKLARLADDHEVFVIVSLFLLFSAIARHWQARLPGGPHWAVTGVGGNRRASLVATVAVAAALAVIMRGFFVGSYRVLSASMMPTLEPNDLLGATKLTFGARPLERGDIVVFKKPPSIEGPERLVKRVVGLPGDRIAMNGGHLVLNGVLLPSCDAGAYVYPISDGAVRGRLSVEFLDDRPYLTVFARGPEPWPVTYDVKPGEVFVLGDNRNNSSDSRSWNHGKGAGLPISDIEARAKWRLFGTHRNDRIDFRSALTPLELHVRLEGMRAAELRQGIETCLRQQPTQSIAEEAHVR